MKMLTIAAARIEANTPDQKPLLAIDLTQSTFIRDTTPSLDLLAPKRHKSLWPPSCFKDSMSAISIGSA